MTEPVLKPEADPEGDLKPEAEVDIQVDEVHLSFPLVAYEPKGVKEALVTYFKRRQHQPEKRLYWALRGISLTVRRGEVLGLVGRNGSGKSTLLRVIAGIYKPDRGKVMTRGRIASLLELGAGFREELNGMENIRLSGAIMGLSPAEISALTPGIIDFAELGQFIGQPLRSYSSGMRSRLGFAVATSVNPDILLIDEALSVGDASFRAKSSERIQALVQSEHSTVLIVSHSDADIKKLCSRVVVINEGQTVSDGEPEAQLQAYHKLLKGS